MRTRLSRACAVAARHAPSLGAVLVLAACAAPAPGHLARDIPLRNPTAPIGATTRFDLAAFSGDWRVLQSAGGDWALRGFSVTPDGDWHEMPGEVAGRVTLNGPGRLALRTADALRDVWVLWVDPEHRVAALGSPEGAFGFVAVRPGPARPDKVAAARDVLEFYGYRPGTWEDL